MENKNIFILVAVILLVVLGVAGYFYWQNYLSPAAKERAVLENAAEKATDAGQAITDSASKGVLPNMDTSAAVGAAASAANTNPFSDIKTNPFK